MCEMTCKTWGICKRSWCQCMSHHALKILRFRGLSFLFVGSCRCPLTVFLVRCTKHSGSSLSLHSSHSPSMLAVSVASDLFDFSLHFISFLIISLITLLFLLPDTFTFFNVVDKYPAYFRWGLWHPGREQLLHKSILCGLEDLSCDATSVQVCARSWEQQQCECAEIHSGLSSELGKSRVRGKSCHEQYCSTWQNASLKEPDEDNKRYPWRMPTHPTHVESEPV